MSENPKNIIIDDVVREIRHAPGSTQEQAGYVFSYAESIKPIRPCFFGAALARIRKRLGISRYEVAKRAGLSEEYLYKLEKSFREPRAGMIVRLGRALGIPPGELVNEMDRLMHDRRAVE